MNQHCYTAKEKQKIWGYGQLRDKYTNLKQPMIFGLYFNDLSIGEGQGTAFIPMKGSFLDVFYALIHWSNLHKKGLSYSLHKLKAHIKNGLIAKLCSPSNMGLHAGGLFAFGEVHAKEDQAIFNGQFNNAYLVPDSKAIRNQFSDSKSLRRSDVNQWLTDTGINNLSKIEGLSLSVFMFALSHNVLKAISLLETQLKQIDSDRHKRVAPPINSPTENSNRFAVVTRSISFL